MAITVNVNGVAISYPQTGDPNWGDDATNFAIQVASVLAKIGQSGAPVNDDIIVNPGNLSVTSGNLTVGGNSTLTGNLTVNGNTLLGNANTDTIGITGIVNIDSGVLYVDPVNNRVGINDTTPSEALDVTGDVAITGNETVGGTLRVTGDVAINTNKFNVTASSGDTTIAGTLGVTGASTFTGQTLSSDGSVSAPGISFSSDINTGLYRIGTDKIGIATNGARVGEIGTNYGGFTGNVIQVAYAELTTSGVTASTSIPFDNTIPQNTEGAEILTCNITPIYSNSKLFIESLCIIGENANNGSALIIALFRDSTANAIASSFSLVQSAAVVGTLAAGIQYNPIYIAANVNSVSTSLTTFKIRVGGENAGAIRWNGANGNQYFGGSSVTYIRVIEVQV